MVEYTALSTNESNLTLALVENQNKMTEMTFELQLGVGDYSVCNNMVISVKTP